MKVAQRLLSLTLFISFVSIGYATAQDTLKAPGVQAILYSGSKKSQPLVVGLGGSEGGNAWSSNYWKATRDGFLSRGYAFLAIGYFNAPGTPKILDQINIEQVYAAIGIARNAPNVDPAKVAVLGGSRGADLALLLGSYYSTINAVVALSPSHVTFPGHTQHFTSAAWSYKGKQLPFVPVNEAAVPFLEKGDLRGTFSAMLQDSIAEKAAMIPVERINGPILFITATEDEVIPATYMAKNMMTRLRSMKFTHNYEHLIFSAGHAEPTKHFDEVWRFLEKWRAGSK